MVIILIVVYILVLLIGITIGRRVIKQSNGYRSKEEEGVTIIICSIFWPISLPLFIIFIVTAYVYKYIEKVLNLFIDIISKYIKL